MDFTVKIPRPGSSAGPATGGDDNLVSTNTSMDVQEIGSVGVDNAVMEGMEADEDTKEDGVENGVHNENGLALERRRLDFADYLKSPIITLLVGPHQEHSLTAHQLFLSRSPYFQDVFNSSPNYHTISLEEDLDAVGSFLQFLYTGEYFPRIIKSPSGDEHLETVTCAAHSNANPDIDETGNQLLKHAKIYTLAEKLGLPELKHLAHSKIHRINSTAKGELAYARYVYANTPREDKTIRVPIASFWAHRSHILRHEAEDEFRRMVLEYPQFAYDILTLLLDQKEKARGDKGRGGTVGGDDDDGGKVERGVVVTKSGGRKRPRLSTLA